MSPSPETPDDGFTLIEVVVALGIVLVLMVAVLPALVLGIRSNSLATDNTRARSVAQAELERMRNLPFHVSVGAGDYVDVLDYYFPDVATTAGPVTCDSGGRPALPTTGWSGYVDDTDRCDWEPPSGPFYRRVRVVDDFVVVVDTQFLTSQTPPTAIAPATTYTNHGDPNGNVRDSPPANQFSARAIVFSRTGPRTPVTSSTQIGRRTLPESRVRADLEVTAVTIGTSTASGQPLVLEVGSASLGGDVNTSSEARLELRSVTATSGDGSRAQGASLQVVAPPASSPASSTGIVTTLGSCALLCWGGTAQSGGTITAVDGLPSVGSPAAPVRSYISDSSNRGFQVRQGPGVTYRADLELDTTQPLARIDNGDPVKFGIAGGSYGCGVSDTAGSPVQVRAGGGGWLRATDPVGSPSQVVQTCGAARVSTIALLPTTFAKDGVVQVRMSGAHAYCGTVGGGHVPEYDYGFTVRIRVWDGSTSADPYRDVARLTVSKASPPVASQALQAFPPSSIVLPGHGTLDRYVASWSSLLDVDHTQETGSSSVEVPGVVRILTTPLRPSDGAAPASTSPDPTATAPPTASPTPTAVDLGDPASTLNLTLGSLSCAVQDLR